MNLELTDKTALVSGSTKGIGFAIATGLAREGARVIVNGRLESAVATAKEQIHQTVPDARTARHSVVWAMVIIGSFYIMTTFLGFGAATIVGRDFITKNGGTNMSAPSSSPSRQAPNAVTGLHKESRYRHGRKRNIVVP